ncbi:MAG: hypothetical protein ACRCU9_10935, partial [Iodobacter sp.]
MSVSTSESRRVRPQYDNKGKPTWTSPFSKPGNGPALCSMVPDRFIPVIFIPGVMGSNLVGIQEDSVKWLLDSSMTMLPWSSPGKDAAFRKEHLTALNMKVFEKGKIMKGAPQSDEEMQRRGWGEVGAMSYGEYLVDLEKSLNDFDADD